MSKVSTNEFKAGLKVEVEGEPYIMVSTEFINPEKDNLSAVPNSNIS